MEIGDATRLIPTIVGSITPYFLSYTASYFLFATSFPIATFTLAFQAICILKGSKFKYKATYKGLVWRMVEG